MSADSEQLKSLEMDLIELKKLSSQSTRSSVRQQLSSLILQTESQIGFLKQSCAQPAQSRSATTSAGCYNKPIKVYGWEQTADRVKVLITSGLSGVSDASENVRCDFKDRGFRLVAEKLNGANHVLEMKNLLHEIDPSGSAVKVMKGDVVQVNMAKVKKVKWEFLTETDKMSNEKSKPKFDPPSDKKDPGESLMDMMKKMYEEGDDDMKRTIAKAWTESREKQNNLN